MLLILSSVIYVITRTIQELYFLSKSSTFFVCVCVQKESIDLLTALGREKIKKKDICSVCLCVCVCVCVCVLSLIHI